MKTFKQAVLDAVLSRGECTCTQVLSAVGGTVSASQAASAGRMDRRARGSVTWTTTVTDRGRARLVADALGRLCREGKIRRVSRGVYAPLAPRVFQPAAAG